MAQQPQPPRTPPAPTASRPAQPSIGELVGRISENVTGLVKGELDLARAKGMRMARAMGVGAVLLAAAAVMALYGLGFALNAVVHLLALALPMWAAQLIVAVVLFLVAAVAAAMGKKRIDAARVDTPAPQKWLRHDVDAVKEAVASGLERDGRQ